MALTKLISQLIKKKEEKKAVKGLFPAELSMVIYAIFTLLLILFTFTNLDDPETLVWWRIRVVALTIALWVVYRIWPCRLMAFARIALLLLTLSWWYPDTYLLNCHFDSLDYIFAGCDQSLFGCQPALIWSKLMPSPFVSELMAMGYFLYFLMFVSMIIYVFFARYKDFQRVSFVIISAFFVYFVIFDLLPVAGPQYYYLAVGVDNIAAGQFKHVGTYFATHTDCLPIPGWDSGVFHNLVQKAHETGERPTAAFPSSHVGISTLTMLVAIRLKEWRYIIIFAIPYIFLCMGTVYLMPHYAVDSIAGFFSAIAVFFALEGIFIKFFRNY